MVSDAPIGLSAQRKFAAIQNRLRAVDQTITHVRTVAGLPNDILDAIDDLARDQRDLSQRISKLWTESQQPVQSLQSYSQRAEQLANEARQRLEEHTSRVAKMDADMRAHRLAMQNQPDNPSLQQQLRALQGQQDEAAVALASVEAQVKTRTDDALELQGKIRTAQTQVDGLLESHRAEFDEMHGQASDLVERSRAVLEQATRERTLAAAGEVVSANTRQFTAALDHHQKQATKFFWATFLVAFAFVVFVIVGFLLAPSQTTRLIPSPVAAASTGGAETDWPHVLVVLGGRLSIVVGAGWLVVFLGKLHARHSQQAVSYQDRLAGLDVIGMMLEHGTQQSREATMRRMTEFYLTQEDNAFRDPPTREPTLKDVRKLLVSVTQPIGDAVKAVGGSIGRGRS